MLSCGTITDTCKSCIGSVLQAKYSCENVIFNTETKLNVIKN